GSLLRIPASFRHTLIPRLSDFWFVFLSGTHLTGESRPGELALVTRGCRAVGTAMSRMASPIAGSIQRKGEKRGGFMRGWAVPLPALLGGIWAGCTHHRGAIQLSVGLLPGPVDQVRRVTARVPALDHQPLSPPIQLDLAQESGRWNGLLSDVPSGSHIVSAEAFAGDGAGDASPGNVRRAGRRGRPGAGQVLGDARQALPEPGRARPRDL